MRSTPDQAGREAIAGMATGVLNMALFGAVWTAAGTGGIEGTVGVVTLIIGWTLAAALCIGSFRLKRSAEALPNNDSTQASTRRRHTLRTFNLVFGLELLAIAVAVLLLILLGLGPLIPSIVALIVGIHFFPLASLFEVRAYYLTGSVLCALALITLLGAPDYRLALVGIGSATTLFVSAAYMLILGGQAIQEQLLKGQ